ncbi:MAG: hypothetical protein ACR2ML_05605 [Solirubrobacteraceae bacterium]
MILLRALVRVLTFVLLVALSLVGLAAAISCIRSGTGSLSLPWLADIAHLPDLRDQVGGWLDDLGANGPVAWKSALGGAAAMALGLLLLAGLVIPRRERLITLSPGRDGRLVARRRPLGQISRALVEQVRGVTQTKARVRPRRRGGGTIKVRADRSASADERDVRGRAKDALEELTSGFRLRAKVRTRLGEKDSRVE